MTSEKKSVKEILAEICEFPIPTYEEWRKVTENSLKGVSFEKKLLTHTYEGITLQPMYRQEDVKDLPHLHSLPGITPYIRGTKAVLNEGKAWEVNQEITNRLPEQFNEALINDLARGQTAVHIVLDKATLEGYDVDELSEDFMKKGVSISSLSDLQVALANVNLSKIPLYVHTGAVSFPFFSLVMAYLKEKNIPFIDLQGSIGTDPLGALVKNGYELYNMEQSYDMMAKVTTWAIKNSPKLETIMVEGHPYHNGGGNAIQELAFSLATGVEYVQAMLERGITINEITPKIRFSFSIGANMFMEIAKLRAARLLWSTIVEAFGGNDVAQKMNIHARTSEWTKTIYDPYVNMLRGTAEAFSGAVGGADSIHVSPFDEAIQPATSFSRRIARNTQIILQEEAHLSKQIDPAGGSWYVELLTDSVARQAWDLFQDVERKGGALQAIQAGFPQQKVAETRAEKARNIDHRKDVFVGMNKYPNAEEKPLDTLENNIHEDMKTRKIALEIHRSSRNLSSSEINVETVDEAVSAIEQGATISDIAKSMGRVSEPSFTIEKIKEERASERFEELREKADTHFAERGQRQQVFLANLGSIPKHKARADFSAEFFEVGGFEVLRNHGFDRAEEAANAALESKARIVIICGTDESYQNQVPELVLKIKDAHPSVTVLLAGKPSEDDQITYKHAGVDDFIHVGSNCYQILENLQNEKGVNYDEKA